MIKIMQVTVVATISCDWHKMHCLPLDLQYYEQLHEVSNSQLSFV